MKAFTNFRSVGIPIDIMNCDTDQIIPARFLRHLPEEGGYDRYLFHDLRFDADGNETDFIYNRAPYRDGRILVADRNWGCGSSREGAVYALVANDIRCVIAPSFGDIHYNNCLRYGVLPVRLPRAACDRLRQHLEAQPGAEIAVDLEAQTVTCGNEVHGFEIEAFDKLRMLQGLDDIGLTRQHDAEFDAFEQRHREAYDWL